MVKLLLDSSHILKEETGWFEVQVWQVYKREWPLATLVVAVYISTSHVGEMGGTHKLNESQLQC